MSLTPWPTTPAAKSAALERLRTLLGRDVEAIPGGDERLDLMASSVAAKIVSAAPGAPEAIRDEALVRGVAYGLDAGSGAEVSRRLGDESLTLAHPGNWYSRSGAGSVLSPWTVRRAGAIGESP